MSSGTRLLRAAALGALCATVPAAATAQTTGELRERVRRLAAIHDVARVAADRADRARREQMDTVREGPLTILAPAALAATARRAARAVAPGVELTFGTTALLLSDTASQPPGLGPVARERWVRIRQDGEWIVLLDTAELEADLQNRIARRAELMLRLPTGHAALEWLGTPVVSLFTERDVTRSLRDSYVDLVTSSSIAARRCFDGELRQCHLALGLVTSADPLTELYDEAGRRWAVRDLSREISRRDATLVRACLDQHIDAACLGALRSISAGVIPLSSFSRTALLQSALDQGGPRAFSRLLETRGPLRHTLEAAAGVPVDSVVAIWRVQVLASRPRTVITRPVLAVTAALWGLIFLAAATRTSRWHRV